MKAPPAVGLSPAGPAIATGRDSGKSAARRSAVPPAGGTFVC
jgi:hypothetical protein